LLIKYSRGVEVSGVGSGWRGFRGKELDNWLDRRFAQGKGGWMSQD
jgi:hypothetical protein